ncbi:MAG: Crp/Fnr family transcriptional regulator [Litoreibacter sp.]|nr:Crp/Fnr family transcriptional regulator [Litoreibacter sp.]
MLNPTPWKNHFPGLTSIPDLTGMGLEGRTKTVQIPSETVVFAPNKTPRNLLVLVSGLLRVQKGDATGRRPVMYRVRAGDGCLLTTACLLGFPEPSLKGVAETELEALAIPRPVFDDLMGSCPRFRAMVFRAYSARIADLQDFVEDLAFNNADVRLARKLLDLQENDHMAHASTEALAAATRTQREVVVHLLEEFQRRGYIRHEDGRIRIDRPMPLRLLAETPSGPARRLS